MHQLFDRYAARYDLHTPPGHYQHDHAFVLAMAAELGEACRMLDVGCGTGVLLEKARVAGIEARGIDAAAAMVAVARLKTSDDAVDVRRMQEIDEEDSYDLVVAMSWTVNYCEDARQLRDVLARMHGALRRGGRVLLQVAHGRHVAGEQMEDRERGPTGLEDDVRFGYRFERVDVSGLTMRATYSYSCGSLAEELTEDHLLHVTDASVVAQLAGEIGFDQVEIYDSWRRDPFGQSASPFVTGVKPPGRP